MLTQLLSQLGPGARIVHLAEEDDGMWWIDVRLPDERYSMTVVTADGLDPDDALQNAVTRALTMFAKEQEGADADAA